MSYAFAISGFLIILFRNKRTSDLFYSRVIKFISEHSMWIYLWHILIVIIFKTYFNEIFWLLKFILVTILSCSIVWLQTIIVEYLKRKNINKEIINVFSG